MVLVYRNDSFLRHFSYDGTTWSCGQHICSVELASRGEQSEIQPIVHGNLSSGALIGLFLSAEDWTLKYHSEAWDFGPAAFYVLRSSSPAYEDFDIFSACLTESYLTKSLSIYQPCIADTPLVFSPVCGTVHGCQRPVKTPLVRRPSKATVDCTNPR